MSTAYSLSNDLLNELAPHGIWRMSRAVEGVVRDSIGNLPRGSVSNDERRYPTTGEGMRAFLNAFFARHFVQVQHTLLASVAPPDLLSLAATGQISIADVGSGPSVAAIAVIDLVAHIRRILLERSHSVEKRPLAVSIVLNDPSRICLDTGEQIVIGYCRALSGQVKVLRITKVSEAFPWALSRIRQGASGGCRYDFSCLSYVLYPLLEQFSLGAIAEAARALAALCNLERGEP